MTATLTRAASYLLGGFSATQPRTLSGAGFNVGADRWSCTDEAIAACAELQRAGAIVDAPGCVGGWYVLA